MSTVLEIVAGVSIVMIVIVINSDAYSIRNSSRSINSDDSDSDAYSIRIVAGVSIVMIVINSDAYSIRNSSRSINSDDSDSDQ